MCHKQSAAPQPSYFAEKEKCISVLSSSPYQSQLCGPCCPQQPEKHAQPPARCVALCKQAQNTLLLFAYFRQLLLVLLTRSSPSETKTTSARAAFSMWYAIQKAA